jgi:uncharacterized membrane protein
MKKYLAASLVILLIGAAIIAAIFSSVSRSTMYIVQNGLSEYRNVQAALYLGWLAFVLFCTLLGFLTYNLASKKGYSEYYWTGFFLESLG